MRTRTTQYRLETAWVISDSRDTDIACEACAEEFAIEKGLTLEWGADSYKDTRPGDHSSDDREWEVYALSSGESDYPHNCTFTYGRCGSPFLDQRLTWDGLDYLIENYAPSVQRLYGYDSEKDLRADLKQHITPTV